MAGAVTPWAPAGPAQVGRDRVFAPENYSSESGASTPRRQVEGVAEDGDPSVVHLVYRDGARRARRGVTSPIRQPEKMGAAVPASPALQAAAEGDRTGRCSHARRAVEFYARRLAYWRAKMGQRSGAGLSKIPSAGNRAVACPRYLARVLQRKAYAARRAWERYRTLRDFDVRPGYSGWQRAVDEVQKVYPGTKGWLLSCSASEGGWGRWVLNSHGAGGWAQFLEPTFWRMFGAARADVTSRGFRVPASAASWRSPLGQALGAAWGVTNGRRHEWFGRGC